MQSLFHVHIHSHTYSKCSMKGGNLRERTRWLELPGNPPIGTFLLVYDLSHTHRAYNTKIKYSNNLIPHRGCKLQSGLKEGNKEAAVMHGSRRLLHLPSRLTFEPNLDATHALLLKKHIQTYKSKIYTHTHFNTLMIIQL